MSYHVQLLHRLPDTDARQEEAPIDQLLEPEESGLTEDEIYALLHDSIALDSDDISFEELFQSLYEERFGDKYLGVYFPQSDGLFGSLPLSDDYGDESDAD